MKTLALDLSTARASLAWFDDPATENPRDAAAQVHEWPNDRKDSGLFFENLQRIVQQFGLPERIMVGLGPGSYAGIRIGISAAIGLQAAAKAELIGYPSVCAIPHASDDYSVIGDARRRSFFFVRIRNRAVIGEYELLDEAALGQRIQKLEPDIAIVSSDLLPQFQPRVEQRYPSAEILGQLAADTGRKFFCPPLEPIYLRDANVTIPKPIMRKVI
jgi:tRNA threonylcarbamoyladenosine biosynthesis protein TsaB